MSTPTVDLQTRVQRLGNHLLRAGRAGRAAILLAMYRSEFARAEAERQLAAQLNEAGESIVRLRVRKDDATVDLPSYLRNHAQSGEAVFFVYDLPAGGEETEQYLNYRREYLIEDGQRLVIWLPQKALGRLARNAPDFWAFRGRTLEFLEVPTPPEQQKLAQDLAYYDWRGDYSQTPEELEAGIRLRRQLLNELPEEPAFDANRAELLYALAGQLAQAGRYGEALQILASVADLAQEAAPHLLSWTANAQGNVYRALQRYEEAIDAYRRAIELHPEYATPWNGLGNVYRALQRYEEAIDAYRRAIELDPEYAIAHASLARELRASGETAEADGHLREARRLMDGERAYNRACIMALNGETEAALELLEVVLQEGSLDPEWALLDPDLQILHDDPRFLALVEKGEGKT